MKTSFLFRLIFEFIPDDEIIIDFNQENNDNITVERILIGIFKQLTIEQIKKLVCVRHYYDDMDFGRPFGEVPYCMLPMNGGGGCIIYPLSIMLKDEKASKCREKFLKKKKKSSRKNTFKPIDEA